jgi:hypothetical protein
VTTSAVQRLAPLRPLDERQPLRLADDSARGLSRAPAKKSSRSPRSGVDVGIAGDPPASRFPPGQFRALDLTQAHVTMGDLASLT